MAYAPASIMAPKEKMRGRAPCWCGSGKQYKNCHFHRRWQKKTAPHKLYEKARALFKKKHCSHPAASQKQCSHIIKAHTISKSSVLKTIAEDGHVYSANARPRSILENDGRIVPAKVGIKNASTFSGFCAKHDNATFEPIEQGGITIDSQSVFLLSYRGIAYEAHQKEGALHFEKVYKEFGDKGKSLEEQIIFQSTTAFYIKHTEMGLKDSIAAKEKWGRYLMSGDYSEFKWLAIRLNVQLPIVSSGGRFPDYDFERNPLYDLAAHYEEPPIVITNIINDSRGAIASLAWLRDDARSIQFAENFIKKIHERGPDFLVHYGIATCDNTYYQPSWWENLTDDQRQKLCDAALSDVNPELPEWFEVIAEPMEFGITGKVVEVRKNF